MDGLLTLVSTLKANEDEEDRGVISESVQRSQVSRIHNSPVATPSEALEALRGSPDYETVTSTLHFLKTSNDFDITSPSPLVAQLVHVLVADVVPDYWGILSDTQSLSEPRRKGRKSNPELEDLLFCLRNITSLSAIVLQLKQCIQQAKESKPLVGRPDATAALEIYQQVILKVLSHRDVLKIIWRNIWKDANTPVQQKILWGEFLTLIPGGKLLSVVAEAETLINEKRKTPPENHWIGDGSLFSIWITDSVIRWVDTLEQSSENAWKCCGQIISKSFRLGYNGATIKRMLSSFALQERDRFTQLSRLMKELPASDQRNFLYATFQILSVDYLSKTIESEANSEWWLADAELIAAAASLIRALITDKGSSKEQLIGWLTSASGGGAGDGIAIRRAAIASLSEQKDDLEMVFERSLAQFGDKLYIRHAPILQQEAHAQILLLCAGHVKRKLPLRLSILMRSGAHLNVVSNRLGSSSPRVRFLGMAIGEALSSLVDKDDKRMDFKMDEMATSEAMWYKSLVNVADSVGDFKDLSKKSKPRSLGKLDQRKSKPQQPKASRGSSKIISIEEISDENDEPSSEDSDLSPFMKPDSDAEDSEEDAELVTRDRSTAPVYIRDLITYLRDTESYDRQKLALMAAPSLIRRKANFGTEVSANVEELAKLLVGLQDKYEIEDFQDLRLHGLIAVLVSQPLKMGQWLAKTFFDGDYSIQQRATVLATLGLGARELAGLSAQDTDLTTTKSQNSLPATDFPSKKLPENMHKFYASAYEPTATAAQQKSQKGRIANSPIDTVTTNLTNSIIAPLAASAADSTTGPALLKLRTFSSRIAVEARRKAPTTNALAQIVADGFFFPLTGRFFMHMRVNGGRGGRGTASNVVFHPFLLSTYIKTLALLLHASGPAAAGLSQMTGEFWDLLLGLRNTPDADADVAVLDALLSSFLTILEVNTSSDASSIGGARLVADHSRRFLETREWVEGVFARLGGGAPEDDKTRMLAAAVLVRVGEVVERYRALLMGDLASF